MESTNLYCYQEFIHSFFFIQQYLSGYCVPGIFLGSGNIAMHDNNKTKSIP